MPDGTVTQTTTTTATTTTTTTFEVNDAVTVVGLVKAPAFNGCSGYIKGALIGGRHMVQITVKGNLPKSLNVRVGNLNLNKRPNIATVVASAQNVEAKEGAEHDITIYVLCFQHPHKGLPTVPDMCASNKQVIVTALDLLRGKGVSHVVTEGVQAEYSEGAVPSHIVGWPAGAKNVSEDDQKMIRQVLAGAYSLEDDSRAVLSNTPGLKLFGFEQPNWLGEVGQAYGAIMNELASEIDQITALALQPGFVERMHAQGNDVLADLAGMRVEYASWNTMAVGQQVVRSGLALSSCVQLAHYVRKDLQGDPVSLALVVGGMHWADLVDALKARAFTGEHTASIKLIAYDCMCDSRKVFQNWQSS